MPNGNEPSNQDRDQFRNMGENIQNQQNQQEQSRVVSNGNIVQIVSQIEKNQETIISLLKNGSQSNFRDQQSRSSVDRFFRDRNSTRNSDRSSRTSEGVRSAVGSAKDNFLDAMKDEMMKGLLGSNYKKNIQDFLNSFSSQFGQSLKDVPGKLGRNIGQVAFKAFSNTNLGKRTQDVINRAKVSARQVVDAGERDTATDRTSRLNDLREPAYRTPSGQSQQEVRSPSDTQTPPTNPVNTSQPNTTNAADPISDTIHSIFDGVFDNTPIPDFLSGFKDGLGELFGGEGGSITKLFSKFFGGGGSSTILGTAGSEATAAGAGAAEAGAAGAGTLVTTGATGAAEAGLSTAALGAEASGAAAGIAGLGTAAASALPIIGEVVAALVVLEAVTSALSPLFEGFGDFMKALSDAGNRNTKEREERNKNADERYRKDIEAIVEEPFQILKDAAQKVEQVWDANLQLINQTQGYNKAALQELMQNYAQRLRAEGLSSVVSSADITESLGKVLQAGLSGQAAEEFSYIASILNAAVPTQDFFSYVDTYTSLAANAQRQGMSQAESLQYANQQLETFASDVLYASRQLSGGFTTGLKDASSLFDAAVRISQTARGGNPGEIAGVLTSISATIGSIAPDLANTFTDAIINAATGGNSQELVALRSLTGRNASNTEFLKQLVEDPQTTFATIFQNLATMYNSTDDAYMERGEAFASTFGLSLDAFARVDFNYLAQQISKMNVNNSSLAENIQLLASGESTTSAEEMRIRQINQYMIDEGLSYVLDNQVARSIQEHMWDEQIADKIMENEFAVNLKGSALDFLEKIGQTVDNLIGLLNPFSWINKIVNVIGTAAEANAQEADLRQILELGKVGNGNIASLTQLTTRGTDLFLTPDLVTLMGGVSMYGLASTGRKVWNALGTPGTTGLDMYNLAGNGISAAIQTGIGNVLGNTLGNNMAQSNYSWGAVGKSYASALYGAGVATGTSISSASGSQVSASTSSSKEDARIKTLNEAFDKLTSEEYVKSFTDAGEDYSTWIKTASKFHITDLDEALEATGRSESDLKAYYEQMQTKTAAEQKLQRERDEEIFWANTQQYLLDIKDYTDELEDLIGGTGGTNELIAAGNETLISISGLTSSLKTYFVDHTQYNKAYDFTDISAVQRKEKSGQETAIYALADALTQNTVDLRDPTVQTNAILSQILLVLQAIMQQNNTVGKLSIPDSLAAMATDLWKATT